MLKIRTATGKDTRAITALLKELDLYYDALQIKNFRVAESHGKIIGAVQLKDHGDFVYLGSLAVSGPYQKKGVAAALLKETLGKIHKDIYLYTIIPKFFEKFGFAVTSVLPSGIPSKDRFECESCHLEKCVCMVKYSHAP